MKLLPIILIFSSSFIPSIAQQAASLNTEQALPTISGTDIRPPLKAYYQWRLSINSDTVSGSLNIVIEPISGKINLKISTNLTKQSIMLNGDTAHGYQLVIPTEKINKKVSSLSAIPIPLFAKIKDYNTLYELLKNGSGLNCKIIQKDDKGPIKLSYNHIDHNGIKVSIVIKRIKCKLEEK